MSPIQNSSATISQPNPRSRLATDLVATVVGSILLALSARIQIPFWPVPMTMQTTAVIFIGMTLGARRGGIVVVAYVLEGLFDLPVFANTPERGAGLAYVLGPTGGYLIGFVVAAFVCGWMAARGFGTGLIRASIANAIGTAIILGFGGMWLAHLFGPVRAFAFGVSPFLLSSFVKIVLGGAIIAAIDRWPLYRVGSNN